MIVKPTSYQVDAMQFKPAFVFKGRTWYWPNITGSKAYVEAWAAEALERAIQDKIDNEWNVWWSSGQ